MNTFTRRSFLQSILALAASAAVPIELIEKTATAINALPEVPATSKSPAGYFKINGLIVPVTWMEISQPMGDITRYGNSYFRSPPELSTITFTTNHHLRFDSEQVTFSISDKHLPFELTGNGYFSSLSTECVLLSSDEDIEHTYSMSCQIDQYKQEEYAC